jgi:hypothetical protein
MVFGFLKRRKKEMVFQVIDPDGDLVMSDVDPISKVTFDQLVKSNPDDFVPGEYVCMCNDEVIWKRTIREKPVKKDKNDDSTTDDPLEYVRKSVERINEEKQTLSEFKNALDEILGSGNIVDLSDAPTGLREGISRGMGAAMYKGLVDRSNETVDRVFSLMDSVSYLMRGLGAWLYNNTGSPSDIMKRVKDKTKSGQREQKQKNEEKEQKSIVDIKKESDDKFTINIGGDDNNE